jgi:hypothetical protein
MVRRIALACFYTLFVVVLLSTWPDGATVITSMPIARWLVMLVPLYWGWVAFGLENRRARRTSVAASVILLVACFIFIVDQDLRQGSNCLWHSAGCEFSRWLN